VIYKHAQESDFHPKLVSR